MATDATIEYRIVEGYRRITGQQLVPLRELGVEITQDIVDRHRWDAYWDAPLDLRTELPVHGNPPPMDGLAGTDQPGEDPASAVAGGPGPEPASPGQARSISR